MVDVDVDVDGILIADCERHATQDPVLGLEALEKNTNGVWDVWMWSECQRVSGWSHLK
jgi:hypothetical protein